LLKITTIGVYTLLHGSLPNIVHNQELPWLHTFV